MQERVKLRVPLERMYIGFELAKDVFKNTEGTELKLVNKDVLLTESLFEKLKTHGIKSIFVYKKNENDRNLV